VCNASFSDSEADYDADLLRIWFDLLEIVENRTLFLMNACLSDQSSANSPDPDPDFSILSGEYSSQ
jgi:hypothetical protein